MTTNCECVQCRLPLQCPSNSPSAYCTSNLSSNCNNWKTDRQPKTNPKDRFTILNPSVMSYDSSYQANSCNGAITYISSDPRLFDAKRGMYTPLDLPPQSANIKMGDIYTQKL